MRGGGVGSEIVASVMRKISRLKAPVETIASLNVPVPCSPRLEDLYMVKEEEIADRIRHMMKKQITGKKQEAPGTWKP